MTDATAAQTTTRNLAASNGNPFLKLQYRLEPDYTAERLTIPPDIKKRMQERLVRLYGEERAVEAYEQLERIMAIHKAYTPPELAEAERSADVTQRFTERDVILITYGDLIMSQDKRPLRALADFAQKMFGGLVTTIHLLPFYPYSSDRGFSVIEYGQVDPELGSWNDIADLKKSFKLMFDGVINHCSCQCKWFRRFLGGDPRYQDFYIAFDSPDAIPPEDMSKILRPRTSPVLSKFDTLDGAKYVWTTFSRDQVDLNFKARKVLLKIFRILLGYVRHGADLIRLDAVTYLWRELGTTCAHLPETHEVIKLLRDVLDVVAPHVALITETNVPHDDNVTYFGNGRDEAQMIYNFALPPLVMHTFVTGDSTALTGWAKELVPPTETTAFFNFLDSHDGIGLMGARGYLTEPEISNLCDTAKKAGGFVSMKSNGDGSESPYELNTTWFSALNPPDSDEPDQLKVTRFIASRAIALVLRGVPGIYMLSMFAKANDLDAVAKDGVYRSINRSALYEDRLMHMTLDRNSLQRKIVSHYLDMLEARGNELAFHPNSPQDVMDFGPNVFVLKRMTTDGSSTVLCVTNVTADMQMLRIPRADLDMPGDKFEALLTGYSFKPASDIWELELKPYEVAWFKRI